MARWRHCALSGEELKLPVVACDLGRYVCREWAGEGGIGVWGGRELGMVLVLRASHCSV